MSDTRNLVLISGGTSGIGLAAAKVLSRDGYEPILLGRDEERGRAALGAVSGSHFIRCDVTKTEECNAAAEAASRLGKIHGLVLSAGIYGEQLLENTTDADIEEFFSVNVFGAMKLARAVIPRMRGAKGSIVSVASDAALEGNVQCSLYSATKGALTSFTRSLALELAVDEIRANVVCPGDVDTPLLERQLAAYGGSREEMAEWYPLGRIAKASEVGEVIAFLISEARNLSCRPLNEKCVKAEIRSTKALFPYRCLCDTDSSARKTLGCASDDDGAKCYQNSAALHYFCAAPPFLISHF